MVKIKSHPFPYTVTDTIGGGPRILWDTFRLRLQFTDCLNMERTVFLIDVCHHCITSKEMLVDEIGRYDFDGVFEVLESKHIDKLITTKVLTREESKLYKHLIIGFDEVGAYLSVVCSTIK